MSLLGKAALFVIREVTQPALENLGKHLGDALGTVIGRRIQPDHEDGEVPSSEGEEEDVEEDPDVGEDERTS